MIQIWNEKEATTLIELLKRRECLWNIFCNGYSERDVREKAYSDIAETFEKQVEAAKVKISRQQGSDKQYHSSWPFWSQLQFLLPVMTAKYRKDNLTTKSCFGVEDEDDKEDVQSPPLTTAKIKKNSNVTIKNMIAEKIIEVLNWYTNSVSD